MQNERLKRPAYARRQDRRIARGKRYAERARRKRVRLGLEADRWDGFQGRGQRALRNWWDPTGTIRKRKYRRQNLRRSEKKNTGKKSGWTKFMKARTLGIF